MSEKTETVEKKKTRARGPVDRLWFALSEPLVWGGLFVLIGLIMVATVLNAMPPQVSSNWWVVAFRSSEALRSVVTLGILGLGVALVLAINRFRAAQGAADPGEPDTVTTDDFEEPSRVIRHAPLLGAVLMVVGAGIALTDWSLAQRQMPPSRLTVPTQQKIEAYPSVTATSSVKVMLPSRAYLRTINVEDQSAVVEFLQVGQEEGEGRVQTLRAFDPVEIADFRWSILGVEYSDSVLSAVVEPDGEGAIPAKGSVGGTLQFEIDGPEYKILRITRNYLGVLGPAVELEHPDDGRFWIFQRATTGKAEPEFIHNFILKRVERAPVGIIAVSQAPTEDLLPAAGVIFVIGLALFLFLPEIIVRRREEGAAIWSLNEASEFVDGEGE